MSVRVSALVWESGLVPHLRYLLLAYADYANDEGESVFPGLDKLEYKTGASIPTVKRNTKLLLATGLLIQTKRGYSGQRAEYVFDMDLLVERVQRAREEYEADHIDTHSEGSHQTREGSHESTGRVSPVAEKGVTGDTPSHQDPPETHQEPGGRVRDLLWETFVKVHGEPATKGERGKYNATVKKLKQANVTPEEYPSLVVAFTTKHNGLQPGVATVAERIGELRHFVARGPVQNRSLEDLAEEQRWDALSGSTDAEKAADYGLTRGEW